MSTAINTFYVFPPPLPPHPVTTPTHPKKVKQNNVPTNFSLEHHAFHHRDLSCEQPIICMLCQFRIHAVFHLSSDHKGFKQKKDEMISIKTC